MLLVEPIPIPRSPTPFFDPYKCLQKAKVQRGVPLHGGSPLPSDARTCCTARSRRTNTDVFSLDLDQQVCPLLPICDPVINGQIVKMNPSHITAGVLR